MKYFPAFYLLMIIINGQTYEIGSRISLEHQSIEIQECANDSGTKSLADYNGVLNGGDYNVIWLNFFASWCTICLAEIPYIANIYDQFYEDGLVVLSLGRQWDYPYSCQEWADLGLANTVLDDDTTSIWSWFGLGYVPQSVILDHNMTVRYNDFGFDAAETVGIIETLISEMPTVSISFESIPDEFIISPLFPNPFNARISWMLDLERDTYVEVNIIDLSGKTISKITKQTLSAGSHTFSWNGSGFSSGVYFLDVATPFHRQTHKMILLK